MQVREGRATCNAFASVINLFVRTRLISLIRMIALGRTWSLYTPRVEMRRNHRRCNYRHCQTLDNKWIMRHEAPSKADCRAKTERNRPYKVPHLGSTEMRAYSTGYTHPKGSFICRMQTFERGAGKVHREAIEI